MRAVYFLWLFLFSGILIAGEVIETRNLNLNADDIRKLEIDCGAGFLKVNGSADADRIVVEAEIIIRNTSDDRAQEIIEKAMILTLENFGSKAKLEAGFDSKRSIFSSIFGRHGSSRINLTVTVPHGIELSIDDGSGKVYVRDTKGDMFLDDGSGDVEIDHVRGDVRIDDGSGDVQVSFVNGRVELDDGSGTINIEKIKGNVFVDDGTGSLMIRDIDGDVEVDDGSGSIEIERVERDVIIKDHGSGSVTIHDVRGKVRRYDD